MDLKDLRNEIDAIDEELVKLFCQRMDVAGRVANFKKANNLPVLDASREEAKILDVMGKATPEMAEYVRQLYKTLFELSRNYQETLL